MVAEENEMKKEPIRMNRKRRRAEEAKNRRAQTSVEKRVANMHKFLGGVEVAVKGLSKQFEQMHKDFPCLQFQRIKSDLTSVQEHLEHMRVFGPDEAHKEIPLEESEQPIEESEAAEELSAEMMDKAYEKGLE